MYKLLVIGTEVIAVVRIGSHLIVKVDIRFLLINSITSIVPAPEVQIHGVDSGNAGSTLNLTCEVTIDSELDRTMVVVTISWRKDSMELTSDEGGFTVSAANIGNSYNSTIEYKTLTFDDSGRYDCRATVSSTSPYLITGSGSATIYITVSGMSTLYMHDAVLAYNLTPL